MIVKYVNHEGDELNLNDGYYCLGENDLRNYEWSFQSDLLPVGYGGRVHTFVKQVADKQIALGIRGTKPEFSSRMNRLLEITEADITTESPGRLWFGEEYLKCYLGVGSTVLSHSRHRNFAVKTLNIVTEDPVWVTEHKQSFYAGSGEIIRDGKKYNLRYPYRYDTGYSMHTLYNDHYASAPMIMTVYGPCVNPVITVGGNQYGANITLLSGERIVLDQVEGTLVKVGQTGIVSNQFDLRVKSSDVFAPIPKGVQVVQFNGSYGFDIILLYRRSEPKWK